jgi:hypothetical protein
VFNALVEEGISNPFDSTDRLVICSYHFASAKGTNSLIAEAFHRTGAVEVWGRGTNRVIEMCQQHGAPPPVFEEKQGFVVVTFRAPLVVGGARGTSGAESGDQVRTKSGPSQDQVGTKWKSCGSAVKRSLWLR